MNQNWPLNQEEVEDLYNDLLTRTEITLDDTQLTETSQITAEEIEFLGNNEPLAGPGLPDPALMALPQVAPPKEMINVEEHEYCSICVDKLCIGDQVIQLTLCSHLFHRKCILVWSQYQKTCPLCRGDLTNDKKDGKK